MNTNTMTCSYCDKSFTLHDDNRFLWSKGACDECYVTLSLDPRNKYTIRLTKKGREGA